MSTRNSIISITLLVFLCLLASPIITQSQETNIVGNGDLETYEPFFFKPVGTSATLTWATDEAFKGIRSLKIEKTAISAEEAGWMSGNQAQTYWNSMTDNIMYIVGARVKSEGVNTDPPDDSYKIGLYVEFLSEGTQIAEDFIPIDQTVATKDWDSVSTVFAIPSGSVPDSAYCFFKFGPNATGTAWADEFILSSDPWTAGFFGVHCENPAGWMEWHSEGEGLAEYTDEDAHGGTYSAKLMELDALSDEIVFYSIPYPCKPDKQYLLSAWLKTDSVNHDPHYLPSNVTPKRDDQRLGVCFFYHLPPLNTAWSTTGGDQFFYANQVDSTEDWRKYEVVSTSPPDAAGVSIRARFTSFPTGTVYFDDFEIREVTKVSGIEEEDKEVNVITTCKLLQNYPNPFTRETYIRYQIPKDTHVNLTIYDMLGRNVVTLLNARQSAGAYTVRWDGRARDGNKVASGIYFYRLTTDNFQSTQKMLVLR